MRCLSSEADCIALPKRMDDVSQQQLDLADDDIDKFLSGVSKLI
jgi:hypothetical protein